MVNPRRAVGIDLDGIIRWATENWVIFAIIGGVVVLVVVVLFLIPNAKVDSHADFATDSDEANDLAIGLVQIRSAEGQWNDPMGSAVAGNARIKNSLNEMWGLNSRDEWSENIERLTTVRRRRPLWTTLLAIRAELVKEGKAGNRKQWIDAIKEAGGSGKGDELDFVNAMIYFEDELRKLTNKNVWPKDSVVTNLDGYALNQAVAVSVWGVAMGVASREESREKIREASDIARSEFGSWGEFGRSLVVGRAMHWSDGQMGEQHVKLTQATAWEFERAMDPKRKGPWAALRWAK